MNISPVWSLCPSAAKWNFPLALKFTAFQKSQSWRQKQEGKDVILLCFKSVQVDDILIHIVSL